MGRAEELVIEEHGVLEIQLVVEPVLVLHHQMVDVTNSGQQHLALGVERRERQSIGRSGVMEIRLGWVSAWDLNDMGAAQFELAFMVEQRGCFHIDVSIFEEGGRRTAFIFQLDH